eukprot:Clim_evm43s11 gene=Clim_evmTU43s11
MISLQRISTFAMRRYQPLAMNRGSQVFRSFTTTGACTQKDGDQNDGEAFTLKPTGDLPESDADDGDVDELDEFDVESDIDEELLETIKRRRMGREQMVTREEQKAISDELQEQFKNRKPLRNYMRARCLYCGLTGHWTHDCRQRSMKMDSEQGLIDDFLGRGELLDVDALQADYLAMLKANMKQMPTKLSNKKKTKAEELEDPSATQIRGDTDKLDISKTFI